MSKIQVDTIADRAGNNLVAVADINKADSVEYLPAGTGAIATGVQRKLQESVSVFDFMSAAEVFAVQNNNYTGAVTHVTAAIQAAFDSVGYAPIYFPPGIYRVTGTGDACLTLSRNRHLIGCGRASTVFSNNASTSTSLIKIAITENGGFSDVRQWRMEGLYTYFESGAGKHGLHIEGGMQILSSQIKSCVFGKGGGVGAYGIYVFNKLAHCLIELCTFDIAYMKCFDANVINKCLTFGTGIAVTFDCENGVRNNTVSECTMVNRDGVVKIVNGDNIRITNNQFELATGNTPSQNQSTPSTMVYLQGVDRPIYNTIIENNNFGGGTNLNHSIYIDNAQRTVIDKNNIIATADEDIYLTANAKFNVIGRENRTAGTIIDPRAGTLFKTLVSDAGVGNMGVLKPGQSYDSGDWVGADFWKDAGGVVHFIGTFSSGTTTGGTVMANMPPGFLPYIQNDTARRNLLTYTDRLENAAWFKTGVAVTANASASPDGGVFADLVYVGTSTSTHILTTSQFATLASTDYSFSLYLKRADAGSANEVRIELNDNSTTKFIRILLNLTSGVTSSFTYSVTHFSAVAATVDALPDGWFRLKISLTTTASGASASFCVGVTPNNVASIYTSYAGVPAVHCVLAWGAQAEQATSSSLYQRITDGATYETVFASRKLLATTSAGVGYVDITRQGVLSVGALPSNSLVGVESFQAASIEV